MNDDFLKGKPILLVDDEQELLVRSHPFLKMAATHTSTRPRLFARL